MYQIKCKITGLVPLLMSRYPLPDNPSSYEKKRQSKKLSEEVIEEGLREKSFIDEKGLYMPADNLRQMLIGNRHRPGAAKILGSTIESKKGIEYLSFCSACVWVMGEDDPLKVRFIPHREKWDSIDMRSFITSTGARDVVRRPQINTPWSMKFIIQVTDNHFTPGKIKEFYEIAGLRCGLGAYGPKFGRFVVEEFKELKAN